MAGHQAESTQDASHAVTSTSKRQLIAAGITLSCAAATSIFFAKPASAASFPGLAAGPASAAEARAAAAGQIPAAPGLDCARFNPEVAASFTRAVSEALSELGVASEEQLQRERFKLFNQEYEYYYESNKERLPRVPDLSDESGGLSNRTYFNFLSYISWKVAARHVQGPEQRTALCRRVGQLLLPSVAPGEAERLKKDALASPGGVASNAAAAEAVQRLMSRLQQSGYTCGWQLVWGEQPGGWPPDWYRTEPQVVGQLPGSEPAENLEWISDLSGDLPVGAQQVFQLKLLQPADIQASVALRSEDDGFWSRHVSSMVGALLAVGGWRAEASEYFYQDDWSGPTSLRGKILLLLGDPLQAVDIPWTPTTLVQDWSAQAGP